MTWLLPFCEIEQNGLVVGKGWKGWKGRRGKTLSFSFLPFLPLLPFLPASGAKRP